MTMEALPRSDESPTRFALAKDNKREPLRECVRDALLSYFRQLDGHAASDLYRLVMTEVEPPLLETVMQHTQGNQTRAAALLGITRSTLRKKLAIYGLD